MALAASTPPPSSSVSGVSRAGGDRAVVAVSWTSPDGDELDLMSGLDPARSPSILLRPEVEGLGAAPREVSRQPLPAGGAAARWSHATERLITLPLLLDADSREEFLALRRQLTLAFTTTAPVAGTPRPGRLRVTRADGSWREIAAVYLAGLEWADVEGHGAVSDIPVVELAAADPWWYGEHTVAVDFELADNRNYLTPYETVSPDGLAGAQQLDIDTDAPAPPVWTLRGPATSVTAQLLTPQKAGWEFGAIAADETITIDTVTATITNQDGDNRIAGLDFPTSSLFHLPAGRVELLVDLFGGSPGPPPSAVRMTYQPRRETA